MAVHPFAATPNRVPRRGIIRGVSALRVSIVIPALNEAREVGEVVRQARALGPDEVIVADGGSTDDTPERALEAGARVVHAGKGRGACLDAGAAAATGDVLLFLHADTRLPDDAVDHIRVSLADERVIGGNFYLRFVPYTPATIALTTWTHLRRRLFGVYGGQSAIFVRRAHFEQLGGFAGLPLLEDYEFVRRLEQTGRTVLLPTWAESSARRFNGREWEAFGAWVAIRTLHLAGVSVERLVKLYADVRE